MSRPQPLVSVVQTSRLLRARRMVALICVLLLLSPGCVHKRVTAREQSGKNLYKPAEPRNLSEYIRTVMKLSYGERHSAASAAKERMEPAGTANAAAPTADDNRRDFTVRLQVAINNLRAGAYLAAFEQLDALEREAPENPLVQIQLAYLWDAWANYGRARAHAERAAAIEPGSDEAWEIFGSASLHARDFTAAGEAYRKCLQLGAETPVRQANLGFALLQQKIWSEAEVHLRRALELDDRMVEARNNLGVTLAYLGKRDEAYSEFLKVSDPATAWNNLGVVLREQKLWIEARAAFRQALELKPDYQKAHRNLAEMNSYLPPPSTIFLPAFPSDLRPPAVTQAAAGSAVSAPVVNTVEDRAPARPENLAPRAVVLAPAAAPRLPASVSIRWSAEPSISRPSSAAAGSEEEPQQQLAVQCIQPVRPSPELALGEARPMLSSPSRLYSPAMLSGEVKTFARSLSRISSEPQSAQQAVFESIRSGVERMGTLHAASEFRQAAWTEMRQPSLNSWDTEREFGEPGIRALRWQRALQPDAFRLVSRNDRAGLVRPEAASLQSLPAWLGAVILLFVFGLVLVFLGLPLAALTAGLFLLIWLGITTANTLHL